MVINHIAQLQVHIFECTMHKTCTLMPGSPVTPLSHHPHSPQLLPCILSIPSRHQWGQLFPAEPFTGSVQVSICLCMCACMRVCVLTWHDGERQTQIERDRVSFAGSSHIRFKISSRSVSCLISLWFSSSEGKVSAVNLSSHSL